MLIEGLSFPRPLHTQANDAIYVTECVAGQLLRIDIDAEAPTCIAPELGVVRAIDVAPDGVLQCKSETLGCRR